MVVLGELYELGARTAGATPAIDVTGTIGFGVVLGPHVAFGGGAAALAFLVADVVEIPVTHHITLPASTAVLALVGGGPLTPSAVAGAVGLGEALVVGAGFGLLGALLGELLQRVLYAHAETHLDPPAASIVVTSLVIGLLATAGVLPSSVWVPTP